MSDASAHTKFVIGVLIRDRVGVLRDIVTPLTEAGANFDGISQTVVAGYFTVLLTATFETPRTCEEVRQAILERFSSEESGVVVLPYRREVHPSLSRGGERYVVTVMGIDRPGILKLVTTFLAARRINIEDWYFAYQGDQVTHIGEITVPPLLDIKQVQDEFQGLLAQVGMRSAIQHVNIFKATNEIGAVTPLLREIRHHA